jgi:hypothetical protein
MRHLTEGELQAFFDGALSVPERAQIEQHLKSCSRCAEQAALVQRRRDHVRGLLSKLERQPGIDPIVPGMAKRRFDVLQRERKERRMARNPFSRRYRPAWAAGALVLLIALTLTIPPARTLAGDLLQLFRVQRIEFTSVSTDALPDEETLEALAPEIERMFEDTLTITSEGEPQEVSETAVDGLARFPVRLPDTDAEGSFEWTPPVHITVQVDLPRWQALFAELGYQDVALPKALDGKTVEAELQGMVSVAYGGCGDSSPTEEDCITFVQMASPSATVPDGLDIDQLGRIYLELLGMPADEAERLSKQIDWTTTLVLPFPHHVNLTYETVHVDGVEGTLIHSESGYRPAPEYLLAWVKGGVVYAVTGTGDHTEALELTESLR